MLVALSAVQVRKSVPGAGGMLGWRDASANDTPPKERPMAAELLAGPLTPTKALSRSPPKVVTPIWTVLPSESVTVWVDCRNVKLPLT